MNKGLVELEKFLKDYLNLCEKLNTNRQEKMLLDNNSPYNLLKHYLESMDNSNPSEALDCFKEIEERCKNDYEYCIVGYDYEKELSTIKQALLKVQEIEKENTELKRVLESIVENPAQSRLVIAYLKSTINPTYEDYRILSKEDLLHQDEFELFKRCVK